MKKAIKIIMVIVTIILSNFAILANTVQALEREQVSLYAKGTFNKILEFEGIPIRTTYVVYAENGTEYPAYCLNRELKGVEENSGYETTNQGKITDLGLWRVIINGYPYKSIEELGVLSIEEAYIATKQAIYCYLCNRGTENYSAIGSEGERALNAMNMILTNAQNSTETFENQQIEVSESEEWKIDTNNEKYVSKEYQLKSNINISKYLINLENAPEGCIITDIQNNVKEEFNSDENFKILIPIESLKESGNFTIKIKSEMETKPVFYGKSPSEDLQNYALTTFSYEDISIELNQEYDENETKIIIYKEDEETGQKLEGAIFEILDENQEVIEKIKTDEQGKIEINQILPGTYYIKEIESPEGYEINQELTKIEINLNEEKSIVITNKQVKEITIEEQETIIEEVRRLPVTGM